MSFIKFWKIDDSLINLKSITKYLYVSYFVLNVVSLHLLLNACEFCWMRVEYLFLSFILSWIIEQSFLRLMILNICFSWWWHSIFYNLRRSEVLRLTFLRIRWMTHKMQYSTRWNFYLNVLWDISWSITTLLLINCIMTRIRDLIHDLFRVLYDDHAFYVMIKYQLFL